MAGKEYRVWEEGEEGSWGRGEVKGWVAKGTDPLRF